MLLLKLSTLLFILITASYCLLPEDFPNFEEYVKKYNKTYTQAEKLIRKPLFQARIQVLIGIDDFTPAVNNFTDWTAEELQVIKGLKFSEQVKKLKISASPSRVGGPATVDWTKTSVTVPKNQGYCGSCWAFAAAAYAQSKLIIDSRYDRTIDLSEQRLLECTKESSCKGGYLQYAMESVLEGIPFQFIFPYDYADYYGSPICVTPSVSIGKIDQNYYDLSDSELQKLVSERPIAISVRAENWENYGSGVFKCPLNLNAKVNHAVLLVGYTDSYWIIKNSWGTNWGQNGFIRVTKTPGMNCGIGTSAHRTFEHNLSSYLFVLVAVLLATFSQ